MPESSSKKRGTPLQANTFDTLIEKAFALKTTPSSTPRLTPEEARRSLATVSTIVPSAPPELSDPESKLLEIWEHVRKAKAKQLEALPSKVKSLEISKPERPEGGLNRSLTKRKSIVNFQDSPDGQMVTATFEMGGVKKQDMHVSFRMNRITVTWHRARVIEKMEGSVKVRERQEKQYNQIIPLPEGTKFEDIRATRDGRRLTLTYPNFKETAKEEPESPRTALSGETEFHTCLP